MFNSEVNARMIYADPGTTPAGEYDVVVLKNIDPATEAGRIFIDLERLGYRVHSIRNAMNANTRQAAPMFFVELVKAPFNATILGMNPIADQNVLIEKYFSNQELVRCSICQGFDHQAHDCSRILICAWCSGPHLTRRCSKGWDFPPSCSSCGGRHPSSYKGCHTPRKSFLETKMMGYRSKGLEINLPKEDQIRLALEGEKKKVQSENSASGEDRVIDSIKGITLTQDRIKLDCLRDSLKFTLEHYLSMQRGWRVMILNPYWKPLKVTAM